MEMDIFNEIGFIAAFVIGSAFVYMAFGDNVLYQLLWLILLGQLILNHRLIIDYVKEVTQWEAE